MRYIDPGGLIWLRSGAAPFAFMVLQWLRLKEIVDECVLEQEAAAGREQSRALGAASTWKEAVDPTRIIKFIS